MRRPVAVVLAAIVLAGGCSDDGAPDVAAPSSTTTETTAEAETTTSAEADTTTTVEEVEEVAALEWEDCEDGFECATLEVPLDHDEPEGEAIELALVRLPASDPDQRIGSLVTNPGGPGVSAIEFVRSAADDFSDDVRARFDIVGTDPRGIGDSTPLDCHDDLQALIAADPSPDDEREASAVSAVSRAFVQACEARHTDLLTHLGTEDVARDLDLVREALGDGGLTYVGLSYGTAIGQVYADLFPDRVRALVLDGAVDVSEDLIGQYTDQSVSFEGGVDAYLDDCSNRSTCPLGDDPGAGLDALLAGIDAAPVEAPDVDRPLGPGEAYYGIAVATYGPDGWPVLDEALTSALDGDGSALVSLADEYFSRSPEGDYPNSQEAYLGVVCKDFERPSAPSDFLSAAEAAGDLAPRIGEANVITSTLPCAFWPVPPEPLSVPVAAGADPIVVVSTTGDPATPYQDGVDLAGQLDSGVLLTVEGQSHVAYLSGNDCVDEIVDAYLLDLEVPEDGTVCG